MGAIVKKIRLSLLIIFALLLVFSASARQLQMKILAVSSDGGEAVGMAADLYLEIKPGTGRIFIDTYPLTRIDTQISNRFANQIACKYTGADCSKYDFIYTIRANSPFIGGPSAGAATALITVAALEGFDVPQTLSISGTINSGNLIGPVGGLKEKIKAGADNGLDLVFIPKGEREVEEDNKTLDLIEFGEEIGIEVKEVSDLDDLYSHITGKSKKSPPKPIEIDKDYQDVMAGLAQELCTRSNTLISEVPEPPQEEDGSFSKVKNTSDENISKEETLLAIQREAYRLTNYSEQAYSKDHHYSAASYCYGAALQSSLYLNIMAELGQPELEAFAEEIQEKIDDLNAQIRTKPKNTISDLEAYIIVRERLVNSQALLDQGLELLELNETLLSVRYLTFADERFHSAVSWTNFFGTGTKNFVLNKEVLKESCLQKIAEAEERYNYVGYFLPTALEDTKKGLLQAKTDAQNEDYELCLFTASKAKAESDIVLSSFGVGENKTRILLAQKLEAAEQVIVDQTDEGIFPILGYSYYEYAQELEGDDIYSALLYSEYALELSNIDIYLHEPEEKKSPFSFTYPNFEVIMIFVLGITVGMLIAALLAAKDNKR